MGQAKLRGSYKERKEQAIKRDAETIEEPESEASLLERKARQKRYGNFFDISAYESIDGG